LTLSFSHVGQDSQTSGLEPVHDAPVEERRQAVKDSSWHLFVDF
jgi:hypothetical protein